MNPVHLPSVACGSMRGVFVSASSHRPPPDMHTLPFEIDCPHCGCADVEVQRAPAAAEWFASGLAACNCCGREFCFRQPDSSGTRESSADAADRDDDYPGVPYVPARCPRCKGNDAPVQHTSGRTRYHLCRRCGLNFKSVEK